MQTKALLFDFDGIIVDTETPSLRAWQEIYEAHGHVLTLDDWASCLGTLGGFDPVSHLEGLLGRPFDDRAAMARAARERKAELAATEPLRPGVEGFLGRARDLGLSVAIVSSDETGWITSHLDRVGHAEGWATITCADGDVTRAKPNPCLYVEALEVLGIGPIQAVVFEDSPNGIHAAKTAGLFCVAVPNDVTRPLDLSAADLHLESFEAMSLDEVLAAAHAR